jgi:hypothetical protein
MRNEARLDITSGFRLNHNQSALEHGCLGTVVELVRHGFRALGGSVVSTCPPMADAASWPLDLGRTTVTGYSCMHLYARAYPSFG